MDRSTPSATRPPTRRRSSAAGKLALVLAACASVTVLPDQSGRVWVLRSGRGSYNPLCDDPEPPRGTQCWIDEMIIDVFGGDGRYLGNVELPENLDLRLVPFIRDDVVIGVVEDEAGTIMVKRYRLVLPGER